MPSETEVTCIYCSDTVNPAKGEGDHVIPAALGEFAGAAQFRRICTKCNNRIGKSEEQLLRCAPESFLRQFVNVKSKRAKRRGFGGATGAHGMKAPSYRAKVGDHEEIVERSREKVCDCLPVDQVIVTDGSGRKVNVRLFPGMRAAQLKERVLKARIKHAKQINIYCNEENSKEYVGLATRTWPNIAVKEEGTLDAGVYRVPVRSEFQFDDHYFRVLAKIGFHYYLVRSPRRFRGDEECFADIRDFIMNGGDIERFCRWDRPALAIPFGQVPGGMLCPSDWCHIVAATEHNRYAIAQVQLFIGPGHVRKPYCINLGRPATDFTFSTPAWGHAYMYHDRQDRFAGRAQELSFVRLR